jgi:hypothetical protein
MWDVMGFKALVILGECNALIDSPSAVIRH